MRTALLAAALLASLALAPLAAASHDPSTKPSDSCEKFDAIVGGCWFYEDDHLSDGSCAGGVCNWERDYYCGVYVKVGSVEGCVYPDLL